MAVGGVIGEYYLVNPIISLKIMSTSGKPSPCTFSSQKKKKLDRFIPHSIERALFASDEKSHASHYQELLGQRLLAPKILPRVLKFAD
jgi:hypothetical protein